jgi:hypothetical protein
MQFELLVTITLPLKPQLQWLWYSDQSRAFIVGDERAAFALPLTSPNAASPLPPARPFDEAATDHHPCNLPIPAALYDEFSAQSWHGFRFLASNAYDHAVDEAGDRVGDLLRTLVFGPDYGHYVCHPASGLVLSLRGGSMKLLRRSGEAFNVLDQAKTRGRAALAFAAHPDEPLIAYGDNYGTFHVHRFDENGFGKATKIAAKERKASRLEFVDAGRMLVIGGMGYLATYAYSGGQFAPVHEVSMAVRDFLWLGKGELVLVNQGLHGVGAYGHDAGGFARLGEVQPQGAVQQIAVSRCLRYLAASSQDSGSVSVYAMPRA